MPQSKVAINPLNDFNKKLKAFIKTEKQLIKQYSAILKKQKPSTEINTLKDTIKKLSAGHKSLKAALKNVNKTEVKSKLHTFLASENGKKYIENQMHFYIHAPKLMALLPQGNGKRQRNISQPLLAFFENFLNLVQTAFDSTNSSDEPSQLDCNLIRTRLDQLANNGDVEKFKRPFENLLNDFHKLLQDALQNESAAASCSSGHQSSSSPKTKEEISLEHLNDFFKTERTLSANCQTLSLTLRNNIKHLHNDDDKRKCQLMINMLEKVATGYDVWLEGLGSDVIDNNGNIIIQLDENNQKSEPKTILTLITRFNDTLDKSIKEDNGAEFFTNLLLFSIFHPIFNELFDQDDNEFFHNKVNEALKVNIKINAQSIIINPVQRFPRYIMLIKAALEWKTDKFVTEHKRTMEKGNSILRKFERIGVVLKRYSNLTPLSGTNGFDDVYLQANTLLQQECRKELVKAATHSLPSLGRAAPKERKQTDLSIFSEFQKRANAALDASRQRRQRPAPPAPHRRSPNHTLNETVPPVQHRINLPVEHHYNYGSHWYNTRFHMFKVRASDGYTAQEVQNGNKPNFLTNVERSGLIGDALKKSILDQITALYNNNEITVDDIKDSAEYRILKTGQGFMSRRRELKTTSQLELESLFPELNTDVTPSF